VPPGQAEAKVTAYHDFFKKLCAQEMDEVVDEITSGMYQKVLKNTDDIAKLQADVSGLTADVSGLKEQLSRIEDMLGKLLQKGGLYSGSRINWDTLG
jgi:hypothetical protein